MVYLAPHGKHEIKNLKKNGIRLETDLKAKATMYNLYNDRSDESTART